MMRLFLRRAGEILAFKGNSTFLALPSLLQATPEIRGGSSNKQKIKERNIYVALPSRDVNTGTHTMQKLSQVHEHLHKHTHSCTQSHRTKLIC